MPWELGCLGSTDIRVWVLKVSALKMHLARCRPNVGALGVYGMTLCCQALGFGFPAFGRSIQVARGQMTLILNGFPYGSIITNSIPKLPEPFRRIKSPKSYSN